MLLDPSAQSGTGEQVLGCRSELNFGGTKFKINKEFGVVINL